MSTYQPYSLHLYNRSPDHDLAIAAWWMHLRDTSELEGVFSSYMQSLSDIYALFAPPRSLVFAADERGICLAMWFEPAMSGAFASLWTRADRRRSPGAYRAIQAIYEMALERWPVLIGVTRQERLLQAHVKLGYAVLGKVPHIWDGNEAWVAVLSKEGWQDGRRRREGRRGSDERLPGA